MATIKHYSQANPPSRTATPPPTIPRSSGSNAILPVPTQGSAPFAATLWPINLTCPRQEFRLTSMQTDPYLHPNPRYAMAGESLPFTVTYEGATTVSSPSVKGYKNRTDISGTLFPTNSPSASGNEVTLSPLTGMVSGDRYVIEITATVDGAVLVRKLVVIVAVTGGE